MECTALKTYMAENFISYRLLAKEMGMSASAIAYMIKRGTCTAEQYQKMVDLGLPVDMLPVPRVPRLRGYELPSTTSTPSAPAAE